MGGDDRNSASCLKGSTFSKFEGSDPGNGENFSCESYIETNKVLKVFLA